MGTSSVYSHNIANVMQYYAKTKDVKVFIIDYLQLIKDRDGEKYRNRNLEIANITGIIKNVARNLGVSAVVLSQLSRATTIGGGRPTLASLRDSGAIEQDADVVMLLHRDVDENTNKLSDIANLEVAKNRFGISDTVTLYFNGTETTFYENAQDPFLDIRY
jgi:replicative DNA helicase